MRPILGRLALTAAAIVVVISCDSALPTSPVLSNSGSRSSNPPTVKIDSPATGALVNIGDSILVSATLHDDRAIRSVSFAGYTVKGSPDLGTWKQTLRYKLITAPPSGSFRPGLTDTTIRRYLQPVTPVDTTLDSLVIRAYVTDSAGRTDSASVRVNIVAGPHVVITLPRDSVSQGQEMSVEVQATQAIGIGSLKVHVQSDSSWPTIVSADFPVAYSGSPRTVTFDTSVTIPANAPLRGKITITASALDVNRQPGAATPVAVYVRTASNLPPLVFDSVPARVEQTDSISVTASGLNIATLGYIVRDSALRELKRASFAVTPKPKSPAQQLLGLALPDSLRGRRIYITGFAVDVRGDTGYAVPKATKIPQGTLAGAVADTSQVVFGRTFRVPHAGTIGDLVIDPRNANVILSNMSGNRLEVFRDTSFDSLGVAVGSLPWGLTISVNPDTLLVANSGGTNLSRVFIGTSNPRNMHEDLAHRILTRNAYIFQVTESRDPATGKLTLSMTGPFLFSDRPQYIGQLADTTIFFSTRPTLTAPKGTVRYINPRDTVPDLHQIITFTHLTGDNNRYLIVNTDSVFIRPSIPSSQQSDTLVIFDHVPGTHAVSDSARSANGVRATIAAIQAVNGSDAGAITGVDIADAGLTDTTFVAVSGDRRWIAFGSGNASTGRIFMTDTARFFSPVTTTADLLNNASEQVFGLALDSTGSALAAHGAQASYFANVEVPFHLRLQGMLPTTLAGGGGIAFHPQAQVFNSIFSNNDATRLAFVASVGNDGVSGEIDIVDAAYYVVRGRLQLKTKLYGPIRASAPFPGDPSDVVLRLYGLSQVSATQSALVTILVRQSDILPVP